MTKQSKKSKFPDLNEVVSIAGKLFDDLKKSVTEIIHNYKRKREEPTEHKEHKQKTTKHKQ